MKTHFVQQTKRPWRHNIGGYAIVWNTRNCMRYLNDENKLQVDEKNKKKQKDLENLWNV